jgi:hypothetical protein
MTPNEPRDDPDSTTFGVFRTADGRLRGVRFLSKRNVLRALILLFLLVPMVACLLRL